MIGQGRRYVNVCLGCFLGLCLVVLVLYKMWRYAANTQNASFICMPDDYIDTPFIKQVKRNGTVVIPDELILEKLSREELSTLYHRYMDNIQYMCKRKVRLGKIDDGGWDICDEDRFRPTVEPCLIYSFGINYDFSFDEAAMKYYNGCEIHSFDPSMNTGDFTKGKIHFHNLGISARDEVTENKWNLLRYSSIRSKLGHNTKEISILKMDIERYEWQVLPDIISVDDLAGTYNLVVEFHLPVEQGIKDPDKDKYLQALKILKSLFDKGYRIFWTHQNSYCKFLSKCKQEQRSRCHEVNFVKVTNKKLKF